MGFARLAWSCLHTAACARLLGPQLCGGTQVSRAGEPTGGQDVTLHLLHQVPLCLWVQITLPARLALKLGGSCCGRHGGSGPQGTWGCAGGWSYLGALGLRSSCCPRCMTLATAIPLPAATETPFKRAPPNVKHWNPTGLVHLSWTPRLGWSAGPHHGATPPLRLSLSPSGFRGESAMARGDGRLLTLSFPRPCSRMLRAMRWACSLVLTRLMLNAMRNFRAPVAVAPQLGTKELGPKSGAHSACLSCGETHPRLWCPPQERRPSKIREGGGHPPLQSAALHPPALVRRHAPSHGGPRTPQPGWPAGSGDWPSGPPPHRGTLQGSRLVRVPAGGQPGTPTPGGEMRQDASASLSLGDQLAFPSAPISLCLVGWVWVVTMDTPFGPGPPPSAHPGTGQAPPLLPPHRCPRDRSRRSGWKQAHLSF